ncbi:hypothetical protein KC349_g1369 [Hortaea werneckii]|nr:hypothetical protein KC349_g1369 [Hortaea werneckii]
MPPIPPTQTSPKPITIRPREPQDVLPLTHLLQTVYERDSYPVQGTTHAREFLTQASTLRAWVAESSLSSSALGEGEKVLRHGDGEDDGKNARGEIVGHVAVSRPREGDVAVRLWRELHQRRGATATAGGHEGQVEVRGEQDQGYEQGEGRTEEEEEQKEEQDVEEGEEEPIAVLERLFIHPSARGQGLASSLLGTAEEWARTTTSLALSPSCSSKGADEPNQHQHQHQQKKQEPKEKKKNKGIRLLLFALSKDEPAMRLYRRRGWAEFGRTGFTWDDEGEGEENKKEMEAICFVSPLPPPSPTAVAAG